MTNEQLSFSTTIVQVLPALLIALGVFHWQEVNGGFRVKHPTQHARRRFVQTAWVLYGLLPVLSEAGLLLALCLSAYRLDVSPLLTWVMPVAMASVLIILVALFGFVAAVFSKESELQEHGKE